MSKKKREKNILSRIKGKLKKKMQRDFQPSSMPFMGGSLFGGGGGKAPKGFRPIPMMQAVVEFANSIMEFVENGTVNDPNKALQIGMDLWNFTLPKVPVQAKKSRQELVNNISKTLKMTQKEAEDFFNRMIERKAYLFPDEIQPEGTMTMFMRKEVEYLITPFDEHQLNISEEPISANDDDQKMLAAMRRMDQYIEEHAEYDEWESHFLSMQEVCRTCYYQWLKAKGMAEEYSTQFSYCIDLYLTFLYQYGNGGLRGVSASAIDEFFMDFVMRKVIAKPPEYTYWPPALRLFYTFLGEKGYLDNPEPMRKLFNDIEPDFIALVKERT